MKHTMILAALLATLSGSALAEGDAGFYGYGSLGMARINLNQGQLDSSATAAIRGASQVSSSVKDDPMAFKLQLGYQFDRDWAVEGGYAHVQQMNYDGTVRVGNARVGISLADQLSIWNLVAAGTLPLGASKWQATGRLGVAHVRQDIDALLNVFGMETDGKTGLTYGLGLKYNLNRNVSFRADYDHYEAIDENIHMWTLGAGYKF